MHLRLPSENHLRLLVGGVLWFVSGLLTINLYLAFALGDFVREIVLVLLALGFEGAKILSWRMGRGYRVLVGFLILLSGLGSLGASLETIQTYRMARAAAVSETPSVAHAKREVADLDRQIDVLLGRLAVLPPDFVTAAKGLNKELDELRAQRSQLSSSLTSQPVDSSEATMFDLMAKVLGVPVETLMLVLLVFLSVCLEASALVMATGGTSVGPGPTGRPEPNASALDFLTTAKQGVDFPQSSRRLLDSGV